MRFVPWNVDVHGIPLRIGDRAAHEDKNQQKDETHPARTHGPHMRRIILCLLAMCTFSGFSLFAVVTPAQAAQRIVPATPLAVAAYARVLSHINPAMPSWQSHELAKRVLINAERWRIDATMLVAIVTVESRWHTHAISAAGAIGLGQLMPGTAASLRVNPRDPGENISGAARYLRGLVGRFGRKRYDLVFAAYNAGPHAVGEYGGVPPYEETQHYVVRVLSTWQALSRIIHVPAAAYDAAPDVHASDAAYWLEDSKNQ